ncbi:MAG: SH3 domain-containing protein [Actinomycetes bacterium]
MSITVGRRVLLSAICLAAVGVVPLTAAIGSRPDDGTGRIVLVSGRDDHGLLASATVGLVAGPGSTKAVDEARDGTLVQVVRTRGEWLDVRTVEGRQARGWVNDFYLRGVVHLVGPAPSCRIPLAGHDHPAGQQAIIEAVEPGRVLVRAQHDGGTGWVPRRHVQEMPPSSGSPCASSHGSGSVHTH